jgi:hypothetical protein
MFGMQSLISKNPETLKAIGSGIIGLFKRRKRPYEDVYQESEIS